MFHQECVSADSIQEGIFFEPQRDILFRHVTDVLADERFDFKLESILQHQLDLFLPRLFVHKSGILRNLAGSLDVLVVELDLDARLELAPAHPTPTWPVASGSWGGRCPSLAPSVTVMAPRKGRSPPEAMDLRETRSNSQIPILVPHRFPVNSHALTSEEGLRDKMRLTR